MMQTLAAVPTTAFPVATNFVSLDRDVSIEGILEENSFLLTIRGEGAISAVSFELTKDFAVELRNFLNSAIPESTPVFGG